MDAPVGLRPLRPHRIVEPSDPPARAMCLFLGRSADVRVRVRAIAAGWRSAPQAA